MGSGQDVLSLGRPFLQLRSRGTCFAAWGSTLPPARSSAILRKKRSAAGDKKSKIRLKSTAAGFVDSWISQNIYMPTWLIKHDFVF